MTVHKPNVKCDGFYTNSMTSGLPLRAYIFFFSGLT